MKKNTTYILIVSALIIGTLIGSFFFPNSQNNSNHAMPDHDHEMMTEEQHWTCSMHPQVDQEKPGFCPICNMELIPVSIDKEINLKELEMTEEAIELAKIQTTEVGYAMNNASTLNFSGRLEADENKSSHLVSHISGRIETLEVSFSGARIKKGEVVATIYAPKIVSAQKELLEAKKIETLSPDLVSAAISKLKYWKISDAFIKEVLSSEKIKSTFPLVSEYSGIVMKKNVTVGDHVNEGEVLFELQNLQHLWAVFDVYERDLSKIKLGQKVTFETPAFLDQKFSGKIIFIDPSINPKTRVAQIRVEIKNKKGMLKPEMFINGTVDLERKDSTRLWVPKSAVLWTGKRSVVYVKVPNRTVPTFAFRAVELGEMNDSEYEIKQGLKRGAEVVINGTFVIDASAQLNNQASMMNSSEEFEIDSSHQ